MEDRSAEQTLRRNRDKAIDRVLSGKTEARWHPTGFAVFHLCDLGAGQRLRLHVWPYGNRPIVSGHPPIHSHHWDLHSMVLAGTYVDILYEDDQLEGDPYFLHEYAYSPDGDSVSPTGTTRLRESGRRSVRTGEFHSIPAGALHQTVITEDASVCTLSHFHPA